MSAFSATFSKRNARCGSSLAWRRPPLVSWLAEALRRHGG
jgi:hypothetical protein